MRASLTSLTLMISAGGLLSSACRQSAPWAPRSCEAPRSVQPQTIGDPVSCSSPVGQHTTAIMLEQPPAGPALQGKFVLRVTKLISSKTVNADVHDQLFAADVVEAPSSYLLPTVSLRFYGRGTLADLSGATLTAESVGKPIPGLDPFENTVYLTTLRNGVGQLLIATGILSFEELLPQQLPELTITPAETPCAFQSQSDGTLETQQSALTVARPGGAVVLRAGQQGTVGLECGTITTMISHCIVSRGRAADGTVPRPSEIGLAVWRDGMIH
jgi:hypothetical protein